MLSWAGGDQFLPVGLWFGFGLKRLLTFQSVLSIKAFGAPHGILPANGLVLHKELGGDKLFRRAQQGRRSSGVALYMRACLTLEIDSGGERVEG